MVTDLLGPSLDDLFSQQGRQFGFKTVLNIFMQVINRIQTFHSIGYIHRDIKPANFLIGLNDFDQRGEASNQNIIHLIDYGLSKKYRNRGHHIKYRTDMKLAGTPRYVSLRTHLGYEQSRRDDLESIGYMMIYFAKGSLTWQGLGGSDKREKHKRIKDKKRSMTSQKLCHKLPIQFKEYMDYVRNLQFDETPNYRYIKRLILRMFNDYRLTNDNIFDWTTWS